MNTNDLLLDNALDFARLSLAGKKRKSGEEVIEHCQRVAETLQRYHLSDPQTLAVALLHHCVADGAASYNDLKKEFGEDLAGMVENFDKLKIIKLGADRSDELVENLRKMFLVLAQDLRVVLIKLSDILDNLTTLEFLNQDKQLEVAKETIEIFAPLAERLGMSELRGQMQDLAFPYVNQEGYLWLKNFTKDKLSKLGKMVLIVKAKIFLALKEEGIEVQLQSRIKHLYSLYTKLMRPEINQDLDKIYDLIALRIITENEEDCYKTLDLVNQLFKPLPEPVSDYIAHPKPNGYQSIHTKVFGPGNLPFEIQIRTGKMHEEAEYGIASHWHYSDIKSKGVSDEKLSQGFAASAEKLEWVKSLAKWQEEIIDNQEFLKTIKTDFFGERIFCFTPKGDVKDLPVGATPIDFAYQVHTDLANMTIGAKINGKVVSLDSKLKNADVVELLLSKDPHKKPNRDWLNFVVTATAKKHIKRSYLGN